MVEGKYRPTRVTASASKGIATGMGCDPRTEDTITLLVDWVNIADESKRGTAVYTASWAAPLKAGVHSNQRFHYMASEGEIEVDQAHRGYSVVEDATGKSHVNPFYISKSLFSFLKMYTDSLQSTRRTKMASSTLVAVTVTFRWRSSSTPHATSMPVSRRPLTTRARVSPPSRPLFSPLPLSRPVAFRWTNVAPLRSLRRTASTSSSNLSGVVLVVCRHYDTRSLHSVQPLQMLPLVTDCCFRDQR